MSATSRFKPGDGASIVAVVDASTALAPPSRGGRTLHRFANPGQFLRLSGALLPWLAVAALAFTLAGLVWGLFWAPADFDQHDSMHIMYVHVPAAWAALSGYYALAVCSVASLVWRHPLADVMAAEIGPVGAGFTALCLGSGSLWGRPDWNTWWAWDARMTSMLVLFFLYLGHVVLVRAFDDLERGYRAGAILALVGAVDLPIIVLSVNPKYFNSLHQPATITLTGAPDMHVRMLWPLLLAAVGFSLGFAALVLARSRAALMERRLRMLLLAKAREAA